MAGTSFRRYRDAAANAEMNVVPLVDVMLVLLVIFIVTAPLLTHAVKIELPRASSQVNMQKPEHVEFGIRENGELFWNGEKLAYSELPARFQVAAARNPQPELHIRADRLTPYENVAKVMSAASKAGLTRIGFLTDPALAQ